MSDKEAKLKLLKLMLFYKIQLIIILFCIITATAITLFLPLINRRIMDDGFIKADSGVFFSCIIGILIINFISSCLELLKERIRIQIKTDLSKKLNELAFWHINKVKVQYLDKRSSVEMLSSINSDISIITSISDSHIFSAVSKCLTVVGGGIGLFIISKELAIIVVLFIPVKCIYTKHFKVQGKKLKKTYLQSTQSYMKWIGEYWNGIKIIRMFNIQKFKEQEFKCKQNNIVQDEIRLSRCQQYNNAIDNIIIQILITVIYMISFKLLQQSTITIGGIFAFISYSSYVLRPIAGLFNIGYFLSIIIPSTKRFYDFINTEEEKHDLKEAFSGNINRIEFKKVNFSYKDKRIIKDFSLTINRDDKIALIGENGSGKTTILNLLLRFYTITSGEILINGRNIYDINLTSYRNLFSIINQDIYLFNDTIRNNICLYKDVKEEDLINVIKDSQLEPFIDEYSLDYVIGDNGAKLSGGQRQKLALARALLQDSPVCIYDEFTSNIDKISESHIKDLLLNNYKNKILIVVTHEINVQSFANRIVILS